MEGRHHLVEIKEQIPLGMPGISDGFFNPADRVTAFCLSPVGTAGDNISMAINHLGVHNSTCRPAGTLHTLWETGFPPG